MNVRGNWLYFSVFASTHTLKQTPPTDDACRHTDLVRLTMRKLQTRVVTLTY
jgi:hypothetical protein